MNTIDNLCVIQSGKSRSVLTLNSALQITPKPFEETVVSLLIFNGTATVDVLLDQAGAFCRLNGIYLTHKDQKATLNFTVRHAKKETISSQIIRGLSGGQSVASFTGKIKIDPSADQSSGSQNHRGILMDETAHIFVRPELEIDTDDVTCSHGSAIGDFDKNTLFYLQSRGLTDIEARRLLIKSFLAESTVSEFDSLIEEWLKNYV